MLLSTGLSGILDSTVSVARTLPPHLLLSLIYRVAVLHLASRIIPQIRKTAAGWNDGMESEPAAVGFWDGRSLGEEPTVRSAGLLEVAGQVLIAEHAYHHYNTLISTCYPDSRLHTSTLYVHIAQYRTPPRGQSLTSVLDAGSQEWWRWINVALLLAVWSLELLLDADDDADSVSRWKVD